MIALRRAITHPVVSGSPALIVARCISILAALLTVSIVVRSLDDDAFGFWSALVSLTTLTAGLDLGISSAVRNRIAALRATGDDEGAEEAFRAALVIIALLSAALATLVLAGSAVALSAGWTEWSSLQIRSVAVTVVFLAAFQTGNLGQMALLARERPAAVAALEVSRWMIAIPALLAIATADGGLLPMTIAYFAALAISALMALPLLLRRHRPSRGFPRPDRAWRIAKRDLWAGAGFASLQIVAALVYQTDILIAAFLTSLAATGDFALVQRIALVPLSLLFAAFTPLWAHASIEIARGNAEWARASATRIAAVACAGLVVCGVMIVALGPWAVALWAGYEVPDRWLYAGVAAWLVVAGWVAVLSIVLNGMGRVWSQVRWLAVAVVIKVAVAILLVERLGVAALAWAAALSLLPLAVSNWREVRRPTSEDSRPTAEGGIA